MTPGHRPAGMFGCTLAWIGQVVSLLALEAEEAA